MTEVKTIPSPNAVRDELIVIAFLVIGFALVCRMSLERPTTSPTEVAKQAAAAHVEPELLGDAR